MQKIDEYLTIRDAALLVGVSSGTLRNWERQGKLKTHRNPVNKYRLYCKQDLEKLLQQINQSFDQETAMKMDKR